MNWNDTALLSVGGLVVIGIAGWMILLTVRLRAIERAVQSIATNTNALREITTLLKSVDANTSLLGGIRGVFGSRDAKRPR